MGTLWKNSVESEADRKLWLDTAASIFKMIYKDKASGWETTKPKNNVME